MKNSTENKRSYKLNSIAFSFAYILVSLMDNFNDALRAGWLVAKLKDGRKEVIYFTKDGLVCAIKNFKF